MISVVTLTTLTEWRPYILHSTGKQRNVTNLWKTSIHNNYLWFSFQHSQKTEMKGLGLWLHIPYVISRNGLSFLPLGPPYSERILGSGGHVCGVKVSIKETIVILLFLACVSRFNIHLISLQININLGLKSKIVIWRNFRSRLTRKTRLEAAD